MQSVAFFSRVMWAVDDLDVYLFLTIPGSSTIVKLHRSGVLTEANGEPNKEEGEESPVERRSYAVFTARTRRWTQTTPLEFGIAGIKSLLGLEKIIGIILKDLSLSIIYQ
ncbi:uncharacterized protein LOC112588390 [Harpegnathos saltator]|uniref:uncharacterized protein LOC112588390 n=1 Tax=Harpegnathos saltator TaxID=610380 RepID=UPI000DBEE583|nr:uncharacterized protein LOC112588390 [Harpegnathos saltator]